MRHRWEILLALMCVAALVTAGCSGSDSASPARSQPSASAGDSDEPALRLVVIGDSIPYNMDTDCPGCTGFGDRYAKALAKATGREVETLNFSEHNSLTLPMLLEELNFFEEYLRSADAIVVGVAHNSIALNADKPCGTTFDEAASTLKDWSKVTARCAKSSATEYRPQYDRLFSTIASWREERPTLLRAINKYNDWIGWQNAHLTADQEHRTVLVHDAWNEMLCKSAERQGFACADIYHAFNGPDGTTPSGELLAADYTHPSDAGNALIARVLVEQGFEPSAE